MEAPSLVGGFLTIFVAIFVSELTDKDALLLLSLATKMKPRLVFLAGAVAFTITTTVIVLLGSQLVVYVPLVWIKIAGGTIMLGYAVLEYARGSHIEKKLEKREERFGKSLARRELYALLGVMGSLILLDLAGDATELLTIVFVAQFQNLVLVFASALAALVLAAGLETALGSRLARVLSARNIRYLSIAVFLIIGSVIILTSLAATA